MNTPITRESLQELADRLIPKFDCPDIDDWVAKGNDVKDTIMCTNLDVLENVPRIRTMHGILEVTYISMCPGTFLMKKSFDFKDLYQR